MASNPVAIDRSGGFGGFSPGAVAIGGGANFGFELDGDIEIDFDIQSTLAFNGIHVVIGNVQIDFDIEATKIYKNVNVLMGDVQIDFNILSNMEFTGFGYIEATPGALVGSIVNTPSAGLGSIIPTPTQPSGNIGAT